MIDLEFFDLKKFLDPRLPEEVWPDLKYLSDVLHLTMEKREQIGVIADGGSGADIIIKSFKQEFKGQVLISNNERKTPEALLPDVFEMLGFKHKLRNWHTAQYGDMLKALTYYCSEINKRLLFVFSQFEDLNAPAVRDFLKMFKLMKGNAGIILRFTVNGSVKFCNHGDSRIRTDILGLDDWAEIRSPSLTEIKDICFASGIKSGVIVDQLVKDFPPLETLLVRIDKLRDVVRNQLGNSQ
jgi:hypothetical protein